MRSCIFKIQTKTAVGVLCTFLKQKLFFKMIPSYVELLIDLLFFFYMSEMEMLYSWTFSY